MPCNFAYEDFAQERKNRLIIQLTIAILFSYKMMFKFQFNKKNPPQVY